MSNIHSTAIIDSSAKIADNVEIGPYTIIGEEVSIGEGTKIGPHCVLKYCDLGKNNTLVASVFIGTPPQDFKVIKEITKVKIGDNNILRECVTIHRSTKPEKPTTLGSNAMLMAYSHIGHDCEVGDDFVLVNSSALAGHVTVGNKVLISGLAAVHQFARVGSMSMLAGGSKVSLDVPPFCRVQGDRAKIVGLNSVGLIRNGMTRAELSELKKTYKLLFFGTDTLVQNITKAKKESKNKYCDELINFCETTGRGLSAVRKKIGIKK